MHDETMPRLPENQSNLDRVVRIGLALVLFALGVSGLFAETEGAFLRIAALVPLATGGLGWCPLYEALGISTREAPAPEPQPQAS
jgi:hypothetical protein